MLLHDLRQVCQHHYTQIFLSFRFWVPHLQYCHLGCTHPCFLVTKKTSLKKFWFQRFRNMASLGFIAPPLDTKAPGPPLIYLVGLLAISDSHINICIRSPNTCVAFKQFNLLLHNTLFWSNFIYYPLTHQFEAITLGRIKTCVKWFWDNS